MGNRLSPITEKTMESGSTQNGDVTYSLCAMQGRRSNMEDAHLAIADLFAYGGNNDSRLDGHSLFAVFDGHGGASAAKFAARCLPTTLLNHKSMDQYIDMVVHPDNDSTIPKDRSRLRNAKKEILKRIFEETFVALDRQLLLAQQEQQKQKMDESNRSVKSNKNTICFKDPGTTVLAVLVTPDMIVCANAGDCRAMLIQDTTQMVTQKIAPATQPPGSIELSRDHRPNSTDEERRIKNAGGYVFGGRLEDDLAVSRGLGDFRFKEEHITIHGICPEHERKAHHQKVSPVPEVWFQPRKMSYPFLFLGCDGVFEVMTGEKVVKVLTRSLIQHQNDLGLACCHVLDKSLRKGSKDNMTALLVHLKN